MALSRSTPRGHKLRSKGKAKSFCINSNAINKNSHCCMLARIHIHSATEISGTPKVEIAAILACGALFFGKYFCWKIFVAEYFWWIWGTIPPRSEKICQTVFERLPYCSVNILIFCRRESVYVCKRNHFLQMSWDKSHTTSFDI